MEFEQLSKEEFEQFEELYHENKDENTPFVFKGKDFLPGYAKYVIEYWKPIIFKK